MRVCRARMLAAEYMGRRHIIEIQQHPDVDSERIHYLQAPSHETALEWLDCLHANRLSSFNLQIKGLRDINGTYWKYGFCFIGRRSGCRGH